MLIKLLQVARILLVLVLERYRKAVEKLWLEKGTEKSSQIDLSKMSRCSDNILDDQLITQLNESPFEGQKAKPTTAESQNFEVKYESVDQCQGQLFLEAKRSAILKTPEKVIRQIINFHSQIFSRL